MLLPCESKLALLCSRRVPRSPSMGRPPKVKLRDVLNTNPYGKTLVAFWDWEGGFVGKIILGLVVGGVLVLMLVQPWKKELPTSQKSATQAGSNNTLNRDGRDVNNGPQAISNYGPVFQGSVTVPGNSNTTFVNSTVNTGPTAELISNIVVQALQHTMQSLKEKKGPDLEIMFPLGYAIFGIDPKDNKIVLPLDAQTNTNGIQIIEFRKGTNVLAAFGVFWKSAAFLSMDNNNVCFRAPSFISLKTRGTYLVANAVVLPRSEGANIWFDISLEGSSATVNNTFTGASWPEESHYQLGPNPKLSIVIQLMKLKDEGVVVVLGIRSLGPHIKNPLEPR
jgi:hypothetical protein